MAGAIVAASQRLALHRFDFGDAEAFKRMNDDPLALRFTGDQPFASVAAARDFLRDYSHYQQHGFGRWSVYLNDGRYGGFCGLRRGDCGEVDLGFRVPVPLWRQGIGFEAAKLALHLGFEQYHLPRIVANAMIDNHASISLLTKLGMTPTNRFEDQHGQWQRFVLTARSTHLSNIR